MIKKRNWFSLILAFAILVGMVPLAAMPVSAAAGDKLVMYIVNPITGLSGAPLSPTVAHPGDDLGYNVEGSIVEVWAVDQYNIPIAVTGWSLFSPMPLDTGAAFVPPAVNPGAVNPVRVQGAFGEAIITAILATPPNISIGKKWGKIDHTEITAPQSIPVTWYEGTVNGYPGLSKTFHATATVTDKVIGRFTNQSGATIYNPVQGVILNWYLLHGLQTLTLAPDTKPEAQNWMAAIALKPSAAFAHFVGGGTSMQTISSGVGVSEITIETFGEEAITVVVIPQYPVPIQLPVEPEYTTINFWTREMEKVPQVRWAGEKIVLEKNFGEMFHPDYVSDSPLYLVRFSLENQSPGSLEGFGNTFIPVGGLNLVNTAQTVWTTVDDNGLASCILVSEDMGEVDVDVALYALTGADNDYTMTIINQHGFVVYFLKLESLALQNVVGKRTGHNTGDWTPSNPWDNTLGTLNVLEETLNVSQDTLLRARVKGWFINANPSMRPEAYLDMDQDGTADLLLPRGRWVLPDDWPALAGPNWKQGRIHWDIMDNPFDAVDSPTPLGTPVGYDSFNGLTTQKVIGPFSPGIELMTPLGWNVQFVSPDPDRPFRTVVPNGVLEWWDAPMPPAKIVFEILDKPVIANFPNGAQDIGNSGFFKWADKSTIYYIENGTRVYTNPFYAEMIPAHDAIPAFVNNGGYDWNSFDMNYGPYEFWTIINRPDLNAEVPTADPAGHPTKVEVYSDNHGEAMVYLNGDWNLNLEGYAVNGAADVPYGVTVGSTTVQAMADYPYFRKHQAILSNTVTKTWIWGGMILGTDGIGYLDGTVAPSSLIINTTGNYTITTPGGPNFPDDIGTSNKKMVWLWLTDRDYLPYGVNGAKVAWRITGGGNSVFISSAYGDLSNYNQTMRDIDMTNGFLTGTIGPGLPMSGKVAGSGDTQGISYARMPTTAELALFAKYYPSLDGENFVVAGIEIQTAGPMIDVSVFMDITSPDFNGGFGGATIYRTANVDFAAAYPLDDQILMGDANVDGTINMGDVTAVEMGILGMMNKNVNADANGDGEYNMADVIKIERSILGLP